MILRRRSPHHPPRDIPMGPGWAAQGTGRFGGVHAGVDAPRVSEVEAHRESVRAWKRRQREGAA